MDEEKYNSLVNELKDISDSVKTINEMLEEGRKYIFRLVDLLAAAKESITARAASNDFVFSFIDTSAGDPGKK